MACATFAAAVLLGAAPAHAGTYAIEPCANGRSHPAANSLVVANLDAVPTACSSGQYADGPTNRGPEFSVRLPSSTPSDITIAALSGEFGFTARNSPLDHYFVRAVIGHGTYASSTNINAPFVFDTGQSTPIGARALRVHAACLNGPECESDYLNDTFYLRGLRILLSDPTPPTVSFESTGLLTPGAKSGTHALTFTAADSGAGLSTVDVDTPSGRVRAASGECTNQTVAACTPSRRSTVQINTDELPVGANQTITVTVTDAAGNVSSVNSPAFGVSRVTATPAAGGPTPTPVPAGPTPTPTSGTVSTPAPLPTVPVTPEGPIVGGVPAPPNGFTPGTVVIGATPGSKAVTKRSRAYGKTLILEGQLLHEGKPLGGVAVDLLQTVARTGATRTKLATVTTDAAGRYRHTLTATVSATLEVAYPEHVGAGDYSASRSVQLAVSAGVALRTDRPSARRGEKVKFAGTVKIDPFPTDRPRVTIQVRSAYGWQDVATLRTNATGAFSWSHAFRTRGAFRFRARVLGQKDLGAVPASSDPTSLLIT